MSNLFDDCEFGAEEPAGAGESSAAGAHTGRSVANVAHTMMPADAGSDSAEEADGRRDVLRALFSSRRNIIAAAAGVLSVLAILALAIVGIAALLGWGQSLWSPGAASPMPADPTPTSSIFAENEGVMDGMATPTALSFVPSPTPVPPPLVLEISAPAAIPVGLPSRVQWLVRLLEGEVATVSIINLSGGLLDADARGDVVVERPLALGHLVVNEEWAIEGVLEPNVGDGTFELSVASSDGRMQGVIAMPWIVADVAQVQYGASTFTITATTINEGGSGSATADEEALVSPGISHYQGRHISFGYPSTWLINDAAGVVTVADNSALLLSEHSADVAGSLVEITVEEAAAPGVDDGQNARALLEQLILNGGANTAGALTVGEIEESVRGEQGVLITVPFQGTDANAGSFSGELAVLSRTNLVVVAQGMTTEEASLSAVQEIIRSITFSDASVTGND